MHSSHFPSQNALLPAGRGHCCPGAAVAGNGALAVVAPLAPLAMLPTVGALGSLEAYIAATHRMPMLSAEEEHTLATRLQQHQDLEAARRLVLSHLRLVVAVARQYLGYGLPHADLIQEGNVGLMKAVKRFDPSRGVRLVSFALHWVKAEIHEYIVRNWRLVKMITTKAHRKLFFNLNGFKQHGKTLSQEQIAAVAAELNVRPEDVRDMERRMAGGELSLDPLGDDGDEYTYNPLQNLAAEGAEPSEVLEAAHHEHQHGPALHTALSSLDARSQHIVRSRWLAEQEGGSKTLHELAAELNVSAERVRQIEAQALKKLRLAMACPAC